MQLAGVTEICPANASLLVEVRPRRPARLDPGRDRPDDRRWRLDSTTTPMLETRIIEVPVWYEDPCTRETLPRFRERTIRGPAATDIDYAAEVNNLRMPPSSSAATRAALVRLHGRLRRRAAVPLPDGASASSRLEVPKYLRPRTDTPKLTVGHGGCFGCIYSVRGAGGYQMFGITPTPIYDPAAGPGRSSRTSWCFFKPGDIVKFKPVDRGRIQQHPGRGLRRGRSATGRCR